MKDINEAPASPTLGLKMNLLGNNLSLNFIVFSKMTRGIDY
jgi:hypothetical protein